MEEIKILINERAGLLYMQVQGQIEGSGPAVLGTQFDSGAQQLVFERPVQFAAHDLVLSMENGEGGAWVVNLGIKNTCLVTSALTQTDRLCLQIAFRRGESYREGANILKFALRKSLNVPEGAPQPPMQTGNPLQRVRENAFADVTLEAGDAVFFNEFGEERGRVFVGGGGSGGASTVAWLPEVSENGDLSWRRSTATTAPQSRNIKGEKGEKGDTGATGAVGPTGLQGPQGIQGPKGDKGDRGEKGADGTGINILGSLSAPSELPATGTPGDAYLISGDLWVWTENTASWQTVGTIQGPQGPAGPRGETGPTGSQGPQGIQGPTGEKGDTGAQGTAGPQGEMGPSGETGPQGPKGDKGDKGDPGAAGTTDHAQLLNRDAANQHPVAAITGAMAASGGAFTGQVSGVAAAADTAPQFRNIVVLPAGSNPATSGVPTGTIILIKE